MAIEYDLDGNIDPFQDLLEGKTWTPHDFLEHYDRNGSFGFDRLIHFHPQQFDNCKTQLNELENRYSYIRMNLDNSEKKENLKKDIIDFLIQLKEKQTQTKFKDLIDNVIKRVFGYPDSDTNKDEWGQIDFRFNNNFDHVPADKVYSYFKENLVDKNYLLLSQLKDFLKSAFEDNKPLNSKLTFQKSLTKERMIKIFFNYHKNLAGKPQGSKPKYVELLGENFEGFDTKTIMTNWSR